MASQNIFLPKSNEKLSSFYPELFQNEPSNLDTWFVEFLSHPLVVECWNGLSKQQKSDVEQSIIQQEKKQLQLDMITQSKESQVWKAAQTLDPSQHQIIIDYLGNHLRQNFETNLDFGTLLKLGKDAHLDDFDGFKDDLSPEQANFANFMIHSFPCRVLSHCDRRATLDFIFLRMFSKENTICADYADGFFDVKQTHLGYTFQKPCQDEIKAFFIIRKLVDTHYPDCLVWEKIIKEIQLFHQAKIKPL